MIFGRLRSKSSAAAGLAAWACAAADGTTQPLGRPRLHTEPRGVATCTSTSSLKKLRICTQSPEEHEEGHEAGESAGHIQKRTASSPSSVVCVDAALAVVDMTSLTQVAHSIDKLMKKTTGCAA